MLLEISWYYLMEMTGAHNLKKYRSFPFNGVVMLKNKFC